jgi:hypothetical protein
VIDDLAHALQLDEAERGTLIRQTCHPAIVPRIGVL